ncbi:class I mannose-6-phosphate isomerase [Fusobacterium sp.]|uniref:class I mannose-6-phosphate isomerase n=1 Tax=Fusobacterium sp. TaxID=68766 RepID=UPI0025BBEA57|nr:class I mannose-6-phosphate isomerase [Fusobacterium sp.]
MFEKIRKSNYDKYPVVEVNTHIGAWNGYNNIIEELKFKEDKKREVIVLDYYHGVNEKEILENLIKKMKADYIFNFSEVKKSEEQILKFLGRNLTDDRVFGILSNHLNITELLDIDKLEKLKNKIENIENGKIIIFGIGASLIPHDKLVYFDLTRWEIQQRFRDKTLDNWGAQNYNEDVLKKYKRAFFVEWRILDNHKKRLFQKINYYIDTNIKNNPKMITGKNLLLGFDEAVSRPFRLVPFFDPGVWGGQWMKKICDLDKEEKNFAWCFDCVPEENSINFKYGDIVIQTPAINLVFNKPKKLLGEKVHARFGTEFPIRFDFLDTFDGENLSLQVHPLTEYIQEKFGMHYTQDESYYILDAKDNAVVYLGVKEKINPVEMIKNLEEAQRGNESFDDERFVNKFPAKKHDHFLIPAGTVHCSGKDTMVLEISSTPYIFTFKLWDWDRLGLDGLPRPIHLEHGKQNIQFDRDTNWVKNNLVNNVKLIKKENGIIEERTGLHEREFIETRRHWFDKKVYHNTEGNLNVLNLIEGEEAIIESPSEKFKPFVVHYAETFIIPATIGEYTISPYGKSLGKQIGTIKAYVR